MNGRVALSGIGSGMCLDLLQFSSSTDSLNDGASMFGHLDSEDEAVMMLRDRNRSKQWTLLYPFCSDFVVSSSSIDR